MDDEAELTENERAQFRALAWRWLTTARAAEAKASADAPAEELDAVDLLDAPRAAADDEGDHGPVSGAVPANASSEVSRRHLKGLLEALIFASDKPMPEGELAKQASAEKKLVKELLHELAGEYEGRGFRLMEVASGWALRTAAIYAPFVRDLAAKKPIRMSRAQTETLAIVAYRQPVTRPEVDDVRGVDSGAALKALLERDLVRVLGKRDEPGRPLIYGTTPQFLEFFGLKTLADLPTLREFTELSDESKRIFERELGEEAPEDISGMQESFAGGEGRVEGELTTPDAPKPDGEDREEDDEDDDESDDDEDDDDESDDDEDDDDESDEEPDQDADDAPAAEVGDAPADADDAPAAEVGDAPAETGDAPAETGDDDESDDDESDDDDDESDDDDDESDDGDDESDDDDDESDDDDDDEESDDGDDESDDEEDDEESEDGNDDSDGDAPAADAVAPVASDDAPDAADDASDDDASGGDASGGDASDGDASDGDEPAEPAK